MNIKFLFQCFILLIGVKCVQAQVSDTSNHSLQGTQNLANKMWNIDVMATGDLPAGDMAKRYGPSYRIGLGLKYKTERNFLFGIKGEFIIGNQMLDDSLLINVQTGQGGAISQQGDLLNIGIFERGYIIGVQAGKIFPILQINQNSGPMMLASVGFMQHHVKMYDRDNSFPQIKGEYAKGYDRLTNGIYVEDFIGYSYYAKNKLINFYAGFNLVWGFTQGRRNYLFDVARPDSGNRNDILAGFKFGWVLPIYKKKSEETYY